MKHVLLGLIFAFSSQSMAAMSCAAYLQSQDSKTPLARLAFDSSGKKHTMTLSKSDLPLDADFSNRFLTGLISHIGGKSTTTSRLEERAVMKEADSQKLLAESGLKWYSRDYKEPGQDFTTVTTYSDKFILDVPGSTEVSVKMRTRKYYGHGIGETDTNAMTSVFGDVGSIELKVKNVAGISADGVKVYPDSIFKPRVFIKDSTLKKLSKTPLAKLKTPEVRGQFIMDIAGVTSSVGGKEKVLNYDLPQIEEFYDALVMLLEQNPDLFQPQVVIAYNRDSYSALTADGTDFQYTLDRNIRIYEPDRRVKFGDTVGYLNNTPLHRVEDGVAFAELKSPIEEKHNNTEDYQKLAHALFSRHTSTFENGDVFREGKGKHSFGVRMRETLGQTTLSAQLYTEGLFYYLVKGVGNLPAPPHDKKLVQRGEIEIALPIQINGREHRLILQYGALSSSGIRPEILKSMKLIDHLGRTVDFDGNKIVELAVEAHAENGNYSKITVDNQSVTFPTLIDAKTVAQFNDFFNDFYRDYDKGRANPREIESLYAVNNHAQLKAYEKRMKWQNRRNWLKERAPKIVSTLVASALTGLAAGYVMATVEVADISSNVSAFFASRGDESTVVQFISGDESLTVKGQQTVEGRFDISPIEVLGPVKTDLTIDLDQLESQVVRETQQR